MQATSFLVRGVLVGAAALAAIAFVPRTGAVTVGEPDLRMARLSDILIATTAGGQKQLRFSAMIVNAGASPFEVTAQRSSATSPFSAWQRIYNSDGSSTLLATPDVSFVFAGDGHTHWHVKDLERYELLRLDNGVKVGTSAKSGFCFFDTNRHLSGAGGAVYTSAGCGREDSLSLTMGISPGWGDKYPWTLPDQYVDISSLDSGKYRLYAEADPAGWFTEANETNNFTWADLALTVNRKGQVKVRVLSYGPSA